MSWVRRPELPARTETFDCRQAMGRLPMYLPFISRSALAKSLPSTKLTKPYPLLFLGGPRIIGAVARGHGSGGVEGSSLQALPHKHCPCRPVEERVKVAAELKEGIEIVLTPEYTSFLSTFFKPFCDILRTVPPQPSDTPEHKLRNTVLDILTRLPQNEAIRGHITELYDVCLNVTQTDNQDNGLPAIKLLLDLQKAYRGFLEAQGGLLAQFIIKCFTDFPATVAELLDPGPEGGEPTFAKTCSQAIPSSKSFKVIAEQPFVAAPARGSAATGLYG
ncbi:putative transcription-associated protein 1 [Tetrabaena socialis]|uniref:Putative transcription-associated protein 1 n=1 Tax=Tetrabaena socialis TaxID=47790 RepID=A0A2J7ZRH4_9CHLO|nr:putative transcription-associated protein 1 [Tetrabaena socialis]|eukprot:PNH02856.1 putative transcription-associated protein 1 [Tetrabaena socialis]